MPLTRDPEPAVDDGGLFIGLMSGTSVDGIDAVLVRFAPRLDVRHAWTFPMDPALAAEVLGSLPQGD